MQAATLTMTTCCGHISAWIPVALSESSCSARTWYRQQQHLCDSGTMYLLKQKRLVLLLVRGTAPEVETSLM